MKLCEKCIQPDTRPGIYFDENNVCGACLWEVEKKSIDWNKRFQELQKIADWAKSVSSTYDCVIGVSGGKDSTFQAITARDRLGLRCLLVNAAPDVITDLGKKNLENLKQLGFDIISLKPNPKIYKKLIKRDFYKYLNPVKITEYSLWSSAFIIADKFDIPLVIQGENPSLTLGVSETGLKKDDNALDADLQNTLKSGWAEYCEIDGISEEDLFFFHYDKQNLIKKNIRAIWIQYYLKEWSMRANADFAKKYGLEEKDESFDLHEIGTYLRFNQLDSDLAPLNQMLKFIKFGFGITMDNVCYDIRENILSRSEAIKLVKEYDGQCSENYIQNFCDYVSISEDEFWSTVEKFRGPMWIRNSEKKWHNTVWDNF